MPTDRLSRILKALANPTVLWIVVLLKQQGPLTLRQIYPQLAIDQSITSVELSKLVDPGIVIRQGRPGSTHYGLADPEAIAVDAVLTLEQKSHLFCL
jgi:predicted transcriptional regulator